LGVISYALEVDYYAIGLVYDLGVVTNDYRLVVIVLLILGVDCYLPPILLIVLVLGVIRPGIGADISLIATFSSSNY
jgi:hypothetical protein